MHYTDGDAEVGGTSTTYRVHADPAAGLELIVVEVGAGSESAVRQVAVGSDEVLYVLDGSGEVVVDGSPQSVSADGAVLAASGSSYRLRAGTTSLCVAIVSGQQQSEVECGAAVTHLDLADCSRHPAVSQREFQLLHEPATGCSGMTQFVGYVPAIRTPRHIHPYDEMLVIVRGSGLVEIEGQEQEVGPGWCYYLPRNTVHLVQNRSSDLLVELGVFTPAGSPTQNTPMEPAYQPTETV